MTLTLELSPEVEAALEAEAARRGVTAPTVAGEVLNEWAQAGQNGGLTETEPMAQITAQPLKRQGLLGKYANPRRTVDDFLREKHAEREREKEREREREKARVQPVTEDGTNGTRSSNRSAA